MEIDNNNTFDNNGHGNDYIADVGNCAAYSATNQLRYKAKKIDLGNCCKIRRR